MFLRICPKRLGVKLHSGSGRASERATPRAEGMRVLPAFDPLLTIWQDRPAECDSLSAVQREGLPMSVTILYQERLPYVAAAEASGEDLWVAAGELPVATGWELRPQGACRGDVCVPLPRDREGNFVREHPVRVNLPALARLLGQPVIHEDAHGVWSFGESAAARRGDMQSLRAPDFTLPDLGGRAHSLSDYRGRKVFLVFWASW